MDRLGGRNHAIGTQAGLVVGVFAVAKGAIPFVLGLHGVEITGMNLTSEAVANLKSQPNGEKLANCALASVVLAN